MAVYSATFYFAIVVSASLIYICFRYHAAVRANGELAAQRVDLELQRQQREAEMAQLQRNVDILTHDREDCKSKQEASDASLRRSGDAVAKCKVDLEKAASGKAEADKQVRACEESRDEQIELASEKTNELKESETSLRLQLTNLQSEMNTTLSRMKDADADVQKLKQQLQTCEAAAIALRATTASTKQMTNVDKLTPSVLQIQPSTAKPGEPNLLNQNDELKINADKTTQLNPVQNKLAAAT